MKILVVTQYFWPEPFRINDLVEELTARGHEVTVLTGKPNYPEGAIYPSFRDDPGTFAEYQGARIQRVPLIPRGKRQWQLALNYLSFALTSTVLGPWKLRGQTFDVIFMFQVSPITAALPAVVLRRLKRAPLLMWILDLWPESLAAVGVVKSPRLLALVGRFVRFIYRRCDRILVQSRAFLANVRGHGGDEDNVRYFPGWAEAAFAGTEPAAPPELEPYAKDFKILFAGNIGDAQDFPAILEAADRLRGEAGLRWIVLGEGRASQWVRAEIKRRRLEEQVVLLGRFPLERMPDFFAHADALLVSLRDEPIFAMTIPGKVQSYLTARRPILAMLDGEGARVIEEAKAGLVAPSGDAAALVGRVRELMAMPAEERSAMGDRGHDYGRREFDRGVLVDSLEGWMRELVFGGDGKAGGGLADKAVSPGILT